MATARGAAPADEVDRARPQAPTACDVCGGPTYEARCKVVCRRCGYTRDCSDP